MSWGLDESPVRSFRKEAGMPMIPVTSRALGSSSVTDVYSHDLSNKIR